jgi:hypothetical protein
MHRFDLLPWLLWGALGLGLLQAALGFRRKDSGAEPAEVSHVS